MPLIAGAVLCIASCGVEDEPETSNADSPLVFETRNVDQIHDLFGLALLKVSSKTTGVPDSGRRDMVAALHARGVGSIRTPEFMAYTSEDGCVDNGSLGRSSLGSGLLTTSSRLATAHHVVSPANFDIREVPCSYEVAFEATRRGSNIVSGELVPYTKDATPAQQWDVVEHKLLGGTWTEAPLLAHRLFALGLESWAVDDVWGGVDNETKRAGIFRRDSLRRDWTFRVDTPPGETFRNVYDALNSQKQVAHDLRSQEHSGRDIAFLEACEVVGKTASGFSLDPLVASFTRSGPFTVSKPGVFFSQARVVEEVPWPEPNPVYMPYHTTWPDDGVNSTVLIAQPGYVAGAPDDKYCASGGYECTHAIDSDTRDPIPGVYVPTRTTYRGCARTSLDVRKTSSGGMALQPEVLSESKLQLLSLVGVGTAHATIGEQWHPGHHVDYLGPSVTTEEIVSEDNLSAGHTSIVGFNADAVAWGRRRGVPVGTIIDGRPSCGPSAGLQPCGGSTPDGEIKLSDEFSGSDVEVETTDLFVPPDESSSAEDPYRRLDPDAVLNTDYPCDSNSYRDVTSGDYDTWGIAVGLMGSSFDGTGVNSVASLRVICAPWRGVSYTDNWDFLYLRGRRVSYPHDVLETGWRWNTAKLSAFLSYAAERARSGTASYLRPASFKMCPPNYFMSGVRGSVSGSLQPYLDGVTHLVCTRSPANPGPTGTPEKLCVATHTGGIGGCTATLSGKLDGNTFPACVKRPDPSGGFLGGDCYDDYVYSMNVGSVSSPKFDSREFTLNQMIGTSGSVNNWGFECPQGTAIATMQLAAAPAKSIVGFKAKCIDLPGPDGAP